MGGQCRSSMISLTELLPTPWSTPTPYCHDIGFSLRRTLKPLAVDQYLIASCGLRIWILLWLHPPCHSWAPLLLRQRPFSRTLSSLKPYTVEPPRGKIRHLTKTRMARSKLAGTHVARDRRGTRLIENQPSISKACFTWCALWWGPDRGSMCISHTDNRAYSAVKSSNNILSFINR